MARCCVCKKEVADVEIKCCESLGTIGLYCTYHIEELQNKWRENKKMLEIKVNNQWDVYDHLKQWHEQIEKQEVKSKLTPIFIYKYKYKWMRFLPLFIIKRFIKPTIFSDCQLQGINFKEANMITINFEVSNE